MSAYRADRLRDEAGEGEPLLVDWRAPAARAFYVATAVVPHGVRRRRHIAMRGRRVTGVDDEAFGRDGLAGASGLAGEAALLAALEATRSGRMRDIVGTLQAEQDAIIRSARSGVLVVQGGPGTGKPGGWSAADVPLLDEAAELLGQDDRAAQVRSARERAQRIAYAQGVLDIAVGSSGSDRDELRVTDLLGAEELAERHEAPGRAAWLSAPRPTAPGRSGT